MRELKKSRTKENLLRAAKELFLEQGYQKTTTSAIARRAETGDGTLFNYYASKAELFLAAMLPASDAEMEGPARKTNVARDICTTITKRLCSHVKPFTWAGKKLLKDYMGAVYQLSEPDGQAAMAAIRAYDSIVSKGIEHLLQDFQSQGRLKPEFELDTAVSCLYAMTVHLMNLYILEEGMTFAQFEKSLEHHVRFALTGYLA